MAVKVLVTDSHAEERQRVASQLEAMGCEAIHAADGDHALACFVVEQPDLVIASAKLPDIQGSRLARVIHSKAPETSIVLIVERGDEVEGDIPTLRRPLDFRALHKLFPSLIPGPSTEEAGGLAAAGDDKLEANVNRLLGRVPPVQRTFVGHRFAAGLGTGGVVGILLTALILALLWPEPPPPPPPEPPPKPPDPEQFVLPASAENLYRKAMRTQLFASYRKKDYAETVAVGNLLRDGYTLDWQTAYTLASAEHLAGLTDEAIADYKAFAKEFPDNKRADDARFKAAELLRARGDIEEARALYQSVADEPKSDYRKSAKSRLAELAEPEPEEEVSPEGPAPPASNPR